MRKGLGYGKGKGYYNLTLRDPVVHSLSARGIRSLQPPTVTLLQPRQFDTRFGKDYSINEIGYATTKIKPTGKVDMYVRHTGDYERTGDLVAHELNELEIWDKLVKKGVDPDKAEEMAHNMNPVKVSGVAETYELDASGKMITGWGQDSDYKGWKKGTKIKFHDRKGVLESDAEYKSSSSSGWFQADVKWADGTSSSMQLNRYGVEIWKKIPKPEKPDTRKIKVVEVSQFFDIKKENWKSLKDKKERGVLPSTTGKSFLWGETPKVKNVKRNEEPAWGQVWYVPDKTGKLKVFKANYDSSG